MEKVVEYMKTGSHTHQSNACELCENLLKRQHAHEVVPIIEFNTSAVTAESQMATTQQNCISESLWKVEAGMISDWLVALSIRCNRLNKQGVKSLPNHILLSVRSQAIQQELSFTNI